MTSDDDRRCLLSIARQAVVAHVGGTAQADVPHLAGRRGGAFVTLHACGTLRGCVGHLDALRLLGGVVRDCAIAACSADPRFPPVSAAELKDIEIELSLLGPLQPIASAEEIEVGRDGLLIEEGGRRGLLLPQVASERRWDRDTFLAQTCRKAGLTHEAWKRGAAVWRFEAEVFGE